jgi:hypothetical protein
MGKRPNAPPLRPRRSAGRRAPWLVALCLLSAVLPVDASSVTRRTDETAERFAKRNGPPQTTLVYHVIETRAWGGTSPAIIAFYEQEFEQSGQGYRRVVGYMYVPEARNTYRTVLIGTFEPEGGDPAVEAVFFARAGRGARPKLIVICSWSQIHYDFRGTLYATFVYTAPRQGAPGPKLTFEKGMSKKLDGGCECEWRDGTKRVAKYKTAADVKAALRAMGYEPVGPPE